MSEKNPQQQPAAQDQQTSSPALDKETAIELRVIITENGAGDFDVRWVAVKKGTEVVVPIRPAHLIGLLEVALVNLEMDIYGGKKKVTL